MMKFQKRFTHFYSACFTEFWPVLESTVEQLTLWQQQNPTVTEIPRSIGQHGFFQ